MSAQAPSSSHSRTSSITHAASAFNSTRQLPKTPHSQRYATATPTLDTGRHVKNQVIKRDRSNELFKRISSSRLCYLLDGEDQADETVYKLGYGNQSANGTSTVVTTDQYESQLSSRGTTSSDSKESKKDPNFMLLDIREKEEYEKCHIDGATHYPAIALKRDQISSTMYSHRSAGHLFILYEDDGESKLAIDAGTLFVQKAFDHVHVLNGGLKAFALKYPDRVSGTDVTAFIKQAQSELPPPSRSSLGSTSRGSTPSTTSTSATESRPTTVRGQGSATSSRPTTRGQTSATSSRPTSSSTRPTSSSRTKSLDTDRPKPFR